MDDPVTFRRRVRRVVQRPGLRAAVVADVNAVVSTGGSASSTQSVHVRQGRSTDRSRHPAGSTTSTRPDDEEPS